MAPQITPRTFCLDQAGDVLDPVGQSLEVYRRCVQHIWAWSELRYARCSAPSPADVQRVRAIQTQQDFLSVITSRHCKRAFVDQAVSPAILGPQPDYSNRAVTLDDVVEERARAAAKGVLLAKGADGRSQAARWAHLRDNLRFYGAPVVMIFHLPRSAVPGTFLEMGFFLQNVMLGLVARGLGSCPQYSVAGYGDVIRAELKLGTDRLIVCSLAVGYADETAPLNRFVPERAPLEDYVQWHD